MALLELPVRDRLEAGWALNTTSTGGGGAEWGGAGGGGGGMSGMGPAAKTDRVVANSTRGLVAGALHSSTFQLNLSRFLHKVHNIHPSIPPNTS